MPELEASKVIIAKSAATKQSIYPRLGAMDCFAALAITFANSIRREAIEQPVTAGALQVGL